MNNLSAISLALVVFVGLSAAEPLPSTGAPTRPDLTAGYHAFSVLGTNAKGKVRPSDLVLVTVRK